MNHTLLFRETKNRTARLYIDPEILRFQGHIFTYQGHRLISLQIV